MLADDPGDAQALFYVGLLLEGRGRVAEAVEHYCRSMAAKPNPPAQVRLQALGRRCDRAPSNGPVGSSTVNGVPSLRREG